MNPAIGDLLEGLVAKYLEVWLVVYCNDEVVAAWNKKLCFVWGISHSKNLSFSWGIVWLSGVGESTLNKCNLPASWTAEWLFGCTLAMLLEKPESNTTLWPICGQADWFGFVEHMDTFFYLILNYCLGFLEELVECVIPVEWYPSFE